MPVDTELCGHGLCFKAAKVVFNKKALCLHLFLFIVKVFEGVLRDGFKIDIKDSLKGMDNLTIEQMFT